MNAAMPVIMTVEEIGRFLIEHGDTILAIKDALSGGQTKAQLIATIRASMVAASDAAVEAELGARPKS
jgi:hypothetical protein